MIPLEIVGMNFENLDMPTHFEKCMIIRRFYHVKYVCFFKWFALNSPVLTWNTFKAREKWKPGKTKFKLCPRKSCSSTEPSNGKQCGFFANKLCCCNLKHLEIHFGFALVGSLLSQCVMNWVVFTFKHD